MSDPATSYLKNDRILTSQQFFTLRFKLIPICTIAQCNQTNINQNSENVFRMSTLQIEEERGGKFGTRSLHGCPLVTYKA